MKRKKPTHGGARKGAGRIPGSFVNVEKKEPTVVMRVPLALVKAIKKLIEKYLAPNSNNKRV